MCRWDNLIFSHSKHVVQYMARSPYDRPHTFIFEQNETKTTLYFFVYFSECGKFSCRTTAFVCNWFLNL